MIVWNQVSSRKIVSRILDNHEMLNPDNPDENQFHKSTFTSKNLLYTRVSLTTFSTFFVLDDKVTDCTVVIYV